MLQKKYPVLSIIIPTYNRASILVNSLNLLADQIYKVDLHNIELVISDNCSSDNTELLVSEYIKKNKLLSITYNVNKSNLGFDANCLVGASIARGKFIWFLSDDDELKPDAISTLLQRLINNSTIVFAFLNYTVLTPGWAEAPKLILNKDKLVNANSLIIETEVAFSCITACVFNREIFSSIDSKKYDGTFWVHLYVIRDIAVKGNSLIISQPIFIFKRPTLLDSRKSANKNKITQREFFIDAHIKFIEFATTFSDQYLQSTKNYVFNQSWKENRMQILAYKLTIPNYNAAEIDGILKDLFPHFKFKFFYWLIDVPLLLLPSYISKLYFYIVLRYVKIKQFIKPFIPNSIFKYYKTGRINLL